MTCLRGLPRPLGVFVGTESGLVDLFLFLLLLIGLLVNCSQVLQFAQSVHDLCSLRSVLFFTVLFLSWDLSLVLGRGEEGLGGLRRPGLEKLEGGVILLAGEGDGDRGGGRSRGGWSTGRNWCDAGSSRN